MLVLLLVAYRETGGSKFIRVTWLLLNFRISRGFAMNEFGDNLGKDERSRIYDVTWIPRDKLRFIIPHSMVSCEEKSNINCLRDCIKR